MTYTNDSLFKVLKPNRMPHFGRGQWPEPGVWRTTQAPRAIPCERGGHGCTGAQLMAFLDYGPDLYEWEYDPTCHYVIDDEKITALRSRLVAHVPAWNERTARLFAADCAEHVIPIYATHADPTPLVHCIAVSRRFANGEATPQELHAATTAAAMMTTAATTAAWAAAKAATAWAAVVDAAGDAAGEQAWQTQRLLSYLNGDAS